MAREDSGSSSGASLTSDEEMYEHVPTGQAPTYQATNPALPSPVRASADASRPTQRPDASVAVAQSTLGPHAKRFKQAVTKVIMLHRTSKPHGVGAEPGVDPRKPSSHQLYGHLTQLCAIDVVDYNAVSARFRRFDNASLRDWLKGREHVRPPWGKVRWIHVNAISWDVLSMLALQYEIHPLALEDILHSRSSSRSKASYYSDQLFLRVLCHTLKESEDSNIIRDIVRSASPVEEIIENIPVVDKDGTFGKNSQQTIKNGSSTISRASTKAEERWQNRDADVNRRVRAAQLAVIKDQDSRVRVNLNNLFVLLWRDGTVLTIHAENGSALFDPIKERLRIRDTILRRTADPSLLVESVLDVVVDEALDIVDEYQDALAQLEGAILSRPKMRLVRSLHIISGDLALLKRSLDPVKSLIFGLRRYDLDRCIAVAAASQEASASKSTAPVVGFMSHKAKIYLADVHDHIEYVLSSMDLFTAQSENLISYTFNMSGYMTNETMRRLTLVTIICLPLSLLTGYFGMNFQPGFWSVHYHTDVFFWEIAIPLLVVIMPMFLWSDIERAIHKIQKRWAAHRAGQEIRAAAGQVKKPSKRRRDHHV